MKNIISFLFIIGLFTNIIIAQETCENDKILWRENQKLEWTDFLGVRPDSIQDLSVAISSVSIELKGDVYEGEIPDWTVCAFFNKNNSWTITDSKQTLEHEQLHFDIAELTARKIRKRFEELMESKERNNAIYFQEYERIKKEGSNLQKKYDSESYFNSAKQKEWISQIESDLLKYKKYKIDK